MRKVDQLRALLEIRTIGSLVADDFASNLFLLSLPLLGHFGVEPTVDTTSSLST
ncbi:MAG: hypothetical protein JOZ74_17440 [Bradyrhizobium sp.]|nr:hypothetical protein [Bradyrhizobium sp.]